ncbi:MAG: hypothetical protein PHY34_02530 [Patescibacteria group bacterium]|nr:hypothetical protein [Patescibacteria group bacterium]MDD5715480.1 hypothetical protein [Patescibacteria group bacterium]
MTILHGLQLIDRAKLPHPEWEFVRTSRDLEKFFGIKDYVGWTIRTVAVTKGAWKNVYTNWLPKNQVPSTIDKFQKQLGGRALFVVYPSWKWKRAGTLLIEKHRAVIETVKGAVVDLMRHGKVDAAYYYDAKLRLASTVGDRATLTPGQRTTVLQAVRKLALKNVILEWGITTQDKFIFYRIEGIREAGRLLLKKYS